MYAKILKGIIFGGMTIGCLIGAIWLIVASSGIQQPTPRELMQKDVILFILSAAFSCILGYYFAKFSNSEKIDTIAERSTEKMVHLTLQLHHLKNYLRDTEDVADEEQVLNNYAALNAYRHRTLAAAEMAASLAYSNETFRSDWLGIVSDSTKKGIEKRYEAVRQFFQDHDTIEKLKLQQTQGEAVANGNTDATARIKELQKRLEDMQNTLPIQSLVPRPVVKQPAVVVNQRIKQTTAEFQEGDLIVEVLRPVFNATGSGKLNPPMSQVPRVSVSLIESPPGLDKENFKCSPGAGTNFDFNVSFKSTAFGIQLPVGKYIFQYHAEEQGPEQVA